MQLPRLHRPLGQLHVRERVLPTWAAPAAGKTGHQSMATSVAARCCSSRTSTSATAPCSVTQRSSPPCLTGKRVSNTATCSLSAGKRGVTRIGRRFMVSRTASPEEVCAGRVHYFGEAPVLPQRGYHASEPREHRMRQIVKLSTTMWKSFQTALQPFRRWNTSFGMTMMESFVKIVVHSPLIRETQPITESGAHTTNS